MEIKAFDENFDHYKKILLQSTFCRTVFCRAPFSRTSLDGCFYKIKDNLKDCNWCLIFKRSLIDREKV